MTAVHAFTEVPVTRSNRPTGPYFKGRKPVRRQSGAVMAEKPIRAAIYARISDDTEGREAGVQRQIEDCQRLAERLGWEIHPDDGILVDNDISASTKSTKPRPNFDKLVEGVSVGEYDGMLYYSNSRLTRRPREYETIIDLVNETGVQLASVVSGTADLTNADGRFVGRVLAAQDAAEAERVSERVARQLLARREVQKLPAPSRRAYGYEAGGIVINEEEAENIRFAARIILDGGSLGEVIREFDIRGIRPLISTHWNRMSVSRMLQSPRNAGLIEHKGKIIGKGDFPAILDMDTWEAVRAKISERKQAYQRGSYTGTSNHLLTGFMTCTCGKPLRINAMLDHENGGLRKDSFIRCVKQTGGCGMKRNLRLVEDYVVMAIRREIEKAPSAESDGDGFDEGSVDVSALLAEIETLESRIRETQAAYSSGDLEAIDFVPVIRSLRENLTNKQAILETLKIDGVVGGDEWLDLWDNGTIEDRRQIMQDMRVQIILRPMGGGWGPKRAAAMIPSTVDIHVYQ